MLKKLILFLCLSLPVYAQEVFWGFDDNGKEICRTTTGNLIKNMIADNPDAGKMSDFSSEGAASDMAIIPTISTPGSSIKGATLGEKNSLGVVENFDPDRYEYLSIYIFRL